jgi:hypothetical protein
VTDYDDLHEDEVIDGLAQAIPYLLASLAGYTKGFSLLGITLQRIGVGEFRCILRGNRQGSADDSVGLVAFTNGGSPARVLHLANESFGGGTIRWHVDRWANGSGKNADSETREPGLGIDKDVRF